MRRHLLFTMLVLTLSTGCMDLYYGAESPRAHRSPEVTVVPGDHRRDFLVSFASDLPRLQEVMGNPPAYYEIDFSSSDLNARVFVGPLNEQVRAWSMDSDGSIMHRAIDSPIDHYDCRYRQPFAMDEATISRLPHLVEDARHHVGYLINPKITGVKISRRPRQLWGCAGVEIDVNFEGECGQDYSDRHGAKFYDCPSGDVIYDTSGNLLHSYIDHDWFRDYD